jgi:hypothetical protein
MSKEGLLNSQLVDPNTGRIYNVDYGSYVFNSIYQGFV